jgi:protein TonB
MNDRHLNDRGRRGSGTATGPRSLAHARCCARAGFAAFLVAAACGSGETVQPPQPMADNAPIDYPVELWDARIGGETLLTIHVDAEGRADSVRVEVTSGSPTLDSAAVRGGRQMRFTPGRKGDRRVGAWIRIPVRFRRDSLHAASATPQSDGGGIR